jgi:hypothetical protein
MTESSSSPRRNPSRPNTQRPRGPKGPSQAPVVELATITTPPELILFNAYLNAEKELERERQRIRQAEITKDKAAARLKELSTGGGSREDIAAAEQEYRDTVEALRRVKAGELAEGASEDAASEDTASEDAAADDGTPGSEAQAVDGGADGDVSDGSDSSEPASDPESEAAADAATAPAAEAEPAAEAQPEAEPAAASADTPPEATTDS